MIDAGEIYESLKGRLTTTLRKSLSVVGPKTLKVNRVWTDDTLDSGDFQSQLDAKLNMRSWAIPVYADISLLDPASGKEIDRAKKLRLMEIPKITPRQSFIVGGEEFQVANQLRLKSGVYVKSIPSETSAHFKFPIGYSKRNFSMDYDPAEKKWTAFLDGKTVPLYSYLNALGLTDEEIAEKLGQEHLDRMKADSDLKKDLAKIRTVVTGEKGVLGEPATNANRVREVLYALPMGPDVPRLKYGKEYKKFEKGLVLDALGNLQGVLSGEEEPDIDSSRFKEFRTFDDILVERIEKSVPLIQGRIKQRMREKSAIRDIIQPDKLSDIVTSFFNRSQLSNYPTQSNPINFLSGHTRTTVFGEGSIGNKRAVTNVERGVDPSMMGTIDPLHSPEGSDIGAVMHVTVGAKKGDGVILRTFLDPKTQKHVTLGHPDVYDKRIAFPNEYRREPSGRLVPVDPSIRVMYRGNVLAVSPAEVDLVVERPQDLFDFSTNLVPFVNAMHGGRGLMASKMYDQAVSVVNPEPPHVRSAATPKKAPDETFERIVGGMATTKSPVDGTVDELGDRQVTVRDTDGKTHKISLYKDFPLNSRSFITSRARVGVGDKVKKGDLLADSNFTKDGDLAIGKNLLVGWVPYRGWSYEDSIVVSESAAKKMTSEHLYKIDHRDSPDGLSGRDRYAAYFPNRFTAEQLAKLDDDGVAKIGSVVRTGDPLVVYLAKKNITPEDVVLGKISRNLVRPYSDSSQTWEEPFDGVVTHAQKTAGGRAKVLVKTSEPLQTGDKIVSRFAAKGLVSRVVPDEEMPQTKDGRPLELVLNPIGLPSRMNPAQIYEALAGKIAAKTGKPYIVDNFERGDLRDRIRQDLKKAGLSETEEVIDPISGRSLGQVTVGNQFLMKLEHAAKEKFSAREPSGAYTADLRPAKSGEGAQAIGHMEQSALLSHGALYNLRDLTNYKCFPRRTKVLTDQGPVDIGAIVNRRMKVRVLTKEDNGSVSFRPVKNYWKRRMDEPLMAIHTLALDEMGRFKFHKIKCTAGHQVYTASGKKQACDLDLSDSLLTVGPVLSPSQESILIGTVLGDGCMQRRTNTFPNLQIRHCVAQIEYAKFKRAAFSGFYQGREQVAVREAGFGPSEQYSFIIGQNPAFTKAYAEFYGKGKKRATDWISSRITRLAIAVWFQDDGCCCETKPKRVAIGRAGSLVVKFATYGFSGEDCERLVVAIRRETGAEFHIVKSPRGPILALYKQKEIDAFLGKIAPYVHPSMAYKLGRHASGCGGNLEAVLDDVAKTGVHETPILRLERPCETTFNDGKFLYDLEVGVTHKYFVHGVLVSNSGKNDEFWRALQMNEPLPPPTSTFAFDKFIALLKGAGINVERRGTQFQLKPLTDDQTEGMSAGAISSSRMLLGKNLKPEKGGLFDEEVTGGLTGQRWAHVDLPYEVPNPIFEPAIRGVMGLTQREYDDIIEELVSVDAFAKPTPKEKGGLTGPAALRRMLGQIDIPKAVQELKKQAKVAKGSDLNHFNRAIRFLSNLKNNQISTDDLFIKKIPVLPPIYRPVYPLPDGTLNVSDVNYLYRDLVAIKNQLGDLSKVLPEEHLREQRVDLYQAVKAIAGMGDPVSSEHYRGILDIVTGEHPKGSYFQSRVIRKQQELSGRAAISGDPTLGMDEVGIPEDMAWVIFKPFTVRKMVERGMAPLEAEKHIADRTLIAKDALGRAMAERPVIINRAPTLHKHGIIALKPTLVPDKSVHLNQMVTVGLGADFDGDSCICLLAIHLQAYRQITHIADFPRIPESAITKGKNVEYDVPPGVLIPAFDGRTIKLMPVTKWSIHPDCDKWIIKTRRRRELIVSQDHSLYTLNPETLQCEKSKPADSVGRLAPIFNGAGNERTVLERVDISGDLTWRPRARVESSVKLDQGFGWLCGAFVGDGWTSERGDLYQLTLAGSGVDHPVVRRWADELRRITDYPVSFSVHPHTFDGVACESAKATNSCHGFAAWLRFSFGHLAENKRLPGFVLGAPLEFRRGLFCGMMDTDGCACWSKGSGAKKSQFSLSFTTISNDLALGVRALGMSLGLQSSISTYRRRNKNNYIVTFSAPQVKGALSWLKLESPQKQEALDRLALAEVGPNRDDKVPFPPAVRILASALLSHHTTATKKFRRVDAVDKRAQTVYAEVRRSGDGHITRHQAKALLAILPVEACLELPERWVDWIQDESIAWDVIESAVDTGEKMVMYDITVPGAWTFCTADGMVVQDTVGIHVPVTDEAVREAQEMMPSTMPLSTSEKVLTVPRHESLVGLYRLTSAGKKTAKTFGTEIDAVMAFHKGEIVETDVVQVGGVETTVGRILVNKTLPEKLRRPDLVIDAKKASEIVEAIARENPRALAPVVDTLKDVGNEYAFLSGLSVGIDDLHIPKARVDEVMSKYDSRAAEATRTTKNRKELDRKFVQIYSKAYDDLKALTSKDFADRNTSLGQMVTSGGRGNIDQATQMLTAPVLVEDVRGKIHPYPIRTGYAHGMSPPDFWVANYGSRKGAVETKLSTAEPGALTKSMVQTSIENRIAPGAPPAEERGLEFSVDDRESIGRYVMAEYPGLARRGDLFDAQLRNRLKAAGKKTVELGSPLMSTHPQGTYLWSYGLDERGRQPRPGAFIGVTAAQAIGEPMTQLILGSKHVQGLAGQARTTESGAAPVATMTGFQKLKTLLEMPEKIDQKALMAREGGIVESVQRAPGGWDVRLDGKTHFTAFEPTVKAGARVNPGDRLSQGLIDPRDLLETKGIDHTRKYLVDEIFGIFGGKVRKKHIETVVRSVTDTALVTDSGQRTDFVEGDIVPINVVRAENRKGAVPVSLDLARNAMLMEEVDRLGGAEKILTDEDIATLKEMGRDRVMANPNPVKFRPILKGVELTPMVRKDWMAGLSYRRLKDVITKGVAEGWKSDLKGWNPIPGLAYGAAIEEPKKTSA